ncbi:MAG: hypothetical protein HOP17_09205, partial [Acidobacteria bacterium]|nr:hypothetical protein [Acidobacteriota bacterium]
WLRNFVFGGVAVWFAFSAVMLFGSSLLSRETSLALNEPKEYCGFYFDCHMHAAVSDVQKTKTIGNRTANGEFYIVKVKIFSDARKAKLGLITVDAHVVDAINQPYARDMLAEDQIGDQPPFEKQISPDERFEKQIVFDLPAGVKEPRLDIKEGYGIDHAIEAVLIGDEDSILHKRNYFDISEQNALAGVK